MTAWVVITDQQNDPTFLLSITFILNTSCFVQFYLISYNTKEERGIFFELSFSRLLNTLLLFSLYLLTNYFFKFTVKNAHQIQSLQGNIFWLKRSVLQSGIFARKYVKNNSFSDRKKLVFLSLIALLQHWLTVCGNRNERIGFISGDRNGEFL